LQEFFFLLTKYYSKTGEIRILAGEGNRVSIPYQQNSSVPYIAHLLTSILIHYPEIATINLDPKERVIKFSFYLKNIKLELGKIEKYIQQALQAYYFLEGITSEVNAFTFEQLDHFTIMEFCRDINTLSQKEISLVIAAAQGTIWDSSHFR